MIRCILLNTGWTGGPHGVGSRMSLKHTRTLLNAALAGDFDDTPSHATYSELAHANKLRRSPRRNFEPERNLGTHQNMMTKQLNSEKCLEITIRRKNFADLGIAAVM